MTETNRQDLGALTGSRASHEAPSGSSPYGFDPERIAEAVEAVEPSVLKPIIRRAAEEFYDTVLGVAEDYLRDNLDWNLKSHLSMLERESRSMRTQPWCTPEERLRRLRELDRACAQLIELRYAVQFEPERAKALAAAARQSGDVQQAPAESPQSGGDSRNAHPLGQSGKHHE